MFFRITIITEMFFFLRYIFILMTEEERRRIFIRLLEERPKARKNKINDKDLKRLAELATENIQIMKELGCWKVEGDIIFYKTNCLGNYYQE